MTELALRDTDSWAPMLPAVNQLAAGIADTEFVPKALRGKQYAVAACVLAGREIGIGPMEALQKIHMVDGRPSLSSELMRSLVLRAGHMIEFTHLTDQVCTIRGRRNGSSEWTELSWTLKDAQRIGVANKDTWKKYPRQMLSARATSELCRLMFPDALGGISYTPEEIEDEKATTVKVVREPAASGPAKVSRTPKVAPPEPVEPSFDEDVDTETGEIVDAEIVEDKAPEFPLVSGAQLTKMSVLFNACGIKDRDERLNIVAGIVGREVASSKELTKPEASAVIDALDAMAAPVEEPPFEDGAA